MKKAALVILLFAGNGMSQSPDVLQSLLAEVRQLRQDIEAMTIASQRVQIALYALQMQDAAVARAARRLDDARAKRASSEDRRSHLAAEVQRLEAGAAAGTVDPVHKNAVQLQLDMMKPELESVTAEWQSGQAAEAEATSQLRTEQVKLGEMQDRIDRLDKSLEKVGSK